MKNLMEKLNTFVGEQTVNEASDDENPKFMFATTDTKLLLQIANGKINAKEWAKQQLESRGFGKKGEWIGFEEAKNLWKSKV